MAHLDFFYTLLSPFTYLAGARPGEIARRHGATIAYRPADFPAIFGETGGLPVPKRHPFRQAYRLQELPRLARKAELKLNLHPAHWPVDATRASQACTAVGNAGGDIGALSFAFLRAVWAEERDISDPATVDAILAAEGHAPAGELDLSAGAKIYAENTALALEKEVFGAPFFVVGEEKFWGQDRLDYLDDHLASLA